MKKLIALLMALMLMTGASAQTMIANPWIDITAEELMEMSGLSFNVPEGAENVIHRLLETQGMAEMQFDLNGLHFNARILPAAEFEDISGLYGEWTSDEPVSIGWCEGRLMRGSDGEDVYDLILWFDAAPGLMYSLSAISAEGTDLLPVAQSVYFATQGEADGLSAEALAEILSGCAYEGTAGSSLKEAGVACRLAAYAAEVCAAQCDLEACTSEAVAMLSEDVFAGLSFHLDGVRALMQDVFRDPESMRPLFDDAGCAEEMYTVLASADAQLHFDALLAQLP